MRLSDVVTLPITTRLDGDGSPKWASPLRMTTSRESCVVGPLPAKHVAEPIELNDLVPRLSRTRCSADARWLGYLSYDLFRAFEPIPMRGTEVRLPLYAFVLADGPAEAPQRTLNRARPARAESPVFAMSRGDYLKSVRRIQQYIGDGDIFQANFAQQIVCPLSDETMSVYERLIARTPALYGAYLDFGGFALLSNSPELFFRVELLPDGRRRIVSRPIKGTRPRLAGMEAELRASAKDQAELAMIVDLQRNDLGRICEIGSIRVTEPRSIEAHPTVFHGVATIEGVLRPDVQFLDVLRAVFPCGSVTGCPKIRAMEIIDELEPAGRGPYCGAIGWIGADGAMEFNVAIRTMIVQEGVARLSVGGGIVCDSDPQAEFDETLVKARAMLAALGSGAELG